MILTKEDRLELLTIARTANKKKVLALIDMLEFCFEEDEICSFYTIIAGFLFYGQEFLAKNYKAYFPCGDIVQDILSECLEDNLLFNKFLHMMHIEVSSCRDYAIEELSQLMCQENRVTLSNTMVYQGCVPSDIKNKVDGLLSCLKDDLNYSLSTTWMHCHLDCGIDYKYVANEKVVVNLYSLSSQALNLAYDRLNTLNDTLKKA